MVDAVLDDSEVKTVLCCIDPKKGGIVGRCAEKNRIDVAAARQYEAMAGGEGHLEFQIAGWADNNRFSAGLQDQGDHCVKGPFRLLQDRVRNPAAEAGETDWNANLGGVRCIYGQNVLLSEVSTSHNWDEEVLVLGMIQIPYQDGVMFKMLSTGGKVPSKPTLGGLLTPESVSCFIVGRSMDHI